MTKREWLVSKGLAKPGRGKFSNDAKAELAKAEVDGMVFDDATPSATPKAKPATVKVKPAATTEDVADDVAMFANELPYAGKRWFAKVNGKRIEISERAACGNCRYSLIAHTCNSPVALSPKGGGFVEVVPSG